MRSLLRSFIPVVGVCCLLAHQATAQIGSDLESKKSWSPSSFNVSRNTIARPVKYVRASRLLLNEPAPVYSKTPNVKRTTSRSASGASRDGGLLSTLRGSKDDLVFGSVGRTRTTLGQQNIVLSPSLMDTQNMATSARSYDLSFGATSKKSSAPRRRLSSP